MSRIHELNDNVVVRRCLSPIAVGTTGIGNGKTGKIIDRQGFDGVMFIVGFGSATATNAVLTPVLFEGDVTGTLTSVADVDMVPNVTPEVSASLPQATPRASGVSKNFDTKIGYKGSKRYVTCKVWGTVTAGPIVGVHAILFNPEVVPVTAAQAVAQ